MSEQTPANRVIFPQTLVEGLTAFVGFGLFAGGAVLAVLAALSALSDQPAWAAIGLAAGAGHAFFGAAVLFALSDLARRLQQIVFLQSDAERRRDFLDL